MYKSHMHTDTPPQAEFELIIIKTDLVWDRLISSPGNHLVLNSYNKNGTSFSWEYYVGYINPHKL